MGREGAAKRRMLSLAERLSDEVAAWLGVAPLAVAAEDMLARGVEEGSQSAEEKAWERRAVSKGAIDKAVDSAAGGEEWEESRKKWRRSWGRAEGAEGRRAWTKGQAKGGLTFLIVAPGTEKAEADVGTGDGRRSLVVLVPEELGVGGRAWSALRSLRMVLDLLGYGRAAR